MAREAASRNKCGVHLGDEWARRQPGVLGAEDKLEVDNVVLVVVVVVPSTQPISILTPDFRTINPTISTLIPTISTLIPTITSISAIIRTACGSDPQKRAEEEGPRSVRAPSPRASHR